MEPSERMRERKYVASERLRRVADQDRQQARARLGILAIFLAGLAVMLATSGAILGVQGWERVATILWAITLLTLASMSLSWRCKL